MGDLPGRDVLQLDFSRLLDWQIGPASLSQTECTKLSDTADRLGNANQKAACYRS
jgi:hypothetical protein